MPNVMSDTSFYVPTTSKMHTIKEPTCKICSDAQHLYDGSRCKCLVTKLYNRYVPTWIREAPRTTKDVPIGRFVCLIGSRAEVGCRLDNLHCRLIKADRSNFENLFPKILTDSFLVRSSFSQGDIGEITFINSPFVMVHQAAIKAHGSMADVVHEYVSTRVNRDRTTWLIRTTPVTPDAYDYSDELAELVTSCFTTIDLR